MKHVVSIECTLNQTLSEVGAHLRWSVKFFLFSDSVEKVTKLQSAWVLNTVLFTLKLYGIF